MVYSTGTSVSVNVLDRDNIIEIEEIRRQIGEIRRPVGEIEREITATTTERDAGEADLRRTSATRTSATEVHQEVHQATGQIIGLVTCFVATGGLMIMMIIMTIHGVPLQGGPLQGIIIMTIHGIPLQGGPTIHPRHQEIIIMTIRQSQVKVRGGGHRKVPRVIITMTGGGHPRVLRAITTMTGGGGLPRVRRVTGGQKVASMVTITNVL